MEGHGQSESWQSVERRRWAEVERENLEGVCEGWADYLRGFAWEWYASFTFRGEPSRGQAYRAWGKMMRFLRGKGAKPSYFRATELQRRGVVHFHALMMGVERVDRFGLMDFWWKHFGMARIWLYEPARGAVSYVGKYVLKDAVGTGDYALDVDAQLWLHSGGRRGAGVPRERVGHGAPGEEAGRIAGQSA